MLSDYIGNANGTTPSQSDKPIEIQLTGPYPAGLNFADNEVPTGAINGINAAFVLANAPVAGSTQVFLNNAFIPLGAVAPGGYTLAASTITFTAGFIPQTGDNLYVSYRY